MTIFREENRKWLIVLGTGIFAITLVLVLKFGTGLLGLISTQSTWEKELDLTQYESWVTYNNEKLKLLIEIPAEWSIDEERNSEDQPTGKVQFVPSQNAEKAPVIEINVSLGHQLPGFTTTEEFLHYKNNGTLPEEIKQYKKVGNMSSKIGESLVFETTDENTIKLLTWIHTDKNNLIIETIGDKATVNEVILFHRYLVSTATIFE